MKQREWKYQTKDDAKKNLCSDKIQDSSKIIGVSDDTEFGEVAKFSIYDYIKNLFEKG